MTVRPIEYGSAEYRAACELRRRFLREPLGLDLTDDDVAGEETQHHFGLFADGEAAGCDPSGGDSAGGVGQTGTLLGGVIGQPDADDASRIRVRQMVVHGDHRGTGLGRTLLAGAERAFVELGYAMVVLYARDEAVPFYERCGYEPTGVTRELIGRTHREMTHAIG